MHRPLLCFAFAAVSLFSSTAFAQYACGGDPVCQAEAEGREAQRLGCAKHEGARMRACIRAGHDAERKRAQAERQAQWEADAPKRAAAERSHAAWLAQPTKPSIGMSEDDLVALFEHNRQRTHTQGVPYDRPAERWQNCRANTTTTAMAVRKQWVCSNYILGSSYVYTVNGVVTTIQEN